MKDTAFTDECQGLISCAIRIPVTYCICSACLETDKSILTERTGIIRAGPSSYESIFYSGNLEHIKSIDEITESKCIIICDIDSVLHIERICRSCKTDANETALSQNSHSLNCGCTGCIPREKINRLVRKIVSEIEPAGYPAWYCRRPATIATSRSLVAKRTSDVGLTERLD